MIELIVYCLYESYSLTIFKLKFYAKMMDVSVPLSIFYNLEQGQENLNYVDMRVLTKFLIVTIYRFLFITFHSIH
ncbi:hypothetical protein BAC7755_56640 [Bacillus sp. MN7755]